FPSFLQVTRIDVLFRTRNGTLETSLLRIDLDDCLQTLQVNTEIWFPRPVSKIVIQSFFGELGFNFQFLGQEFGPGFFILFDPSPSLQDGFQKTNNLAAMGFCPAASNREAREQIVGKNICYLADQIESHFLSAEINRHSENRGRNISRGEGGECGTAPTDIDELIVFWIFEALSL